MVVIGEEVTVVVIIVLLQYRSDKRIFFGVSSSVVSVTYTSTKLIIV